MFDSREPRLQGVLTSTAAAAAPTGAPAPAPWRQLCPPTWPKNACKGDPRLQRSDIAGAYQRTRGRRSRGERALLGGVADRSSQRQLASRRDRTGTSPASQPHQTRETSSPPARCGGLVRRGGMGWGGDRGGGGVKGDCIHSLHSLRSPTDGPEFQRSGEAPGRQPAAAAEVVASRRTSRAVFLFSAPCCRGGVKRSLSSRCDRHTYVHPRTTCPVIDVGD